MRDYLILCETSMLETFRRICGVCPYIISLKKKLDTLVQSCPYEHHCKCYKKLASRSWPVLFTLTCYFPVHAFSSSARKEKVVVIAVFLSKLDHRLLFNNICYQTVVRIGFNMISKCRTLPIVYTMVVKIR